MIKVKKINHIAIVVDHIEDSLSLWNILGLESGRIRDVPQHESRVAFLPLGDLEIELVEPTSDSSGIARYLAKHGPGLHHICIEVEDIDGVLATLEEKGIDLIYGKPQSSDDGRKYAFIHPKSANGVLVELYEDIA
ncbi:MAG: methylmalonyl-CoA epimerase [Anaerolineales bacterium]|jgi:methylmalonyl-CoA/ethylmalonyl-CoA epimerase